MALYICLDLQKLSEDEVVDIMYIIYLMLINIQLILPQDD